VREIEQHAAVDAAPLLDLLPLGTRDDVARGEPSVISTPFERSVVGWNCMNSMSFSGTPARQAIVMPSAVHEYAFVVP
jgi:hypothetical protein